MTAPLYLARARLRRDAPVAALRGLLAPHGESARVAAGHRLVWTLFADAPERERDFLWREAEPGLFYLLSRRVPTDDHGLFELDAPKIFAPSLARGDRLAFSLRANATTARVSEGKARANGRVRGKPCDVVMNALQELHGAVRADERSRAITQAGLAWLAAQGARNGFALPSPASGSRAHREADGEREQGVAVRVLAYRTWRVDHAGPTARLGVLDFEGELQVSEPELFLAALARGFGRAKAFGCGLMLVRRA